MPFAGERVHLFGRFVAFVSVFVVTPGRPFERADRHQPGCAQERAGRAAGHPAHAGHTAAGRRVLLLGHGGAAARRRPPDGARGVRGRYAPRPAAQALRRQPPLHAALQRPPRLRQQLGRAPGPV